MATDDTDKEIQNPMKHTIHESRKSFLKWAMAGQRVKSDTPPDVHHRTTSKQPHSQMSSRPPAFVKIIKSRDGLLPRNVVRSRGGAKVASKGKVIPSQDYADYLYNQ